MSPDLKDTCTPEQRKNVDAWVVAWLERLRDPNSKQNKASLIQFDYIGDTKDAPKCCLGHLGQLAVEAGHAEWENNFLSCADEGSSGFLPVPYNGSTNIWLGSICSGKHFCGTLAGLNDNIGLSLKEIAEVIEHEVIKAPWGGILYTGGKNNAA